PADVAFNPWIYSDSRKAVAVSGWGYFRTEFIENAEFDRDFGFDATVRAGSSLTLTLSPEFSHQLDPDQFLTSVEDEAAAATFGTRYVFGDIEQTALSLGLRAGWTFTPDLSLQLYARPFVATGRYAGFKEFRAPGTYDFDVYGRDKGAITEHDGT